MKNRITTYRKTIDTLLTSPQPDTDWQKIIAIHKTQIAFFQHERLVHLIVTMTFALLAMISTGIALVTGLLTMLAVTGLLLVLLIPYIFHYYTLENEVQKMYGQYDQMVEKMSGR